MRKGLILVGVGILLALSALPWIVQPLLSQPLVPDSLQQAPRHYQATVDAVQAATRLAEQQATSQVQIRIIGTVVPSAASEPSIIPSAILSEPTAYVQVTQTEAGSSITISTVIPSLAPTLPVDASPVPPVNTNPPLPTLAAGWTTIDDILTEEELTGQIEQDAEDDTVSNLVIVFSPTGVKGTGTYLVSAGVRQPLEVEGMFAVERESLVTKITSIRIAGVDVTAQHRDRLESSLNTSLYRLLPQRYVQSYELTDGLVRVHSRMRQ